MDPHLRNGRVYMNDGAGVALCQSVAPTCVQRVAICIKSQDDATIRQAEKFVEMYLQRCPARQLNIMTGTVTPLLRQA